MSAPRFITSEAQLGAPGVYVIEQAPAIPTRGQRRRVAGFVGECVRGPVNKPVLCSSYQRFLDVFGGRDRNGGGPILGKVWKSLQNKRWGQFYVVRAAAAAAVAASYTLETTVGGAGTAIVRIDAAAVGAAGNDIQWKVLAATNGDNNYFNLAIKLYGKVTLYQNLSCVDPIDNTRTVIKADDANLVILTKLASGRPYNSIPGTDGADATNGYTFLGQTVAGFTSVVGSDGSIADADFTAAGKGIITLNSVTGVHACAVSGRSNSAIKTAIKALTINQKVWYVCPDDETVSQANAITERATFNTDKISYWFNHAQNIDPITRELIWEEPFLSVMSTITQTDPDVHPGDYDNASYFQYIQSLYNTLGDPDRDALDAGGVSFLNTDLDASGNQIIIPGNALTCDFATNNQDLDGRYMKDFILNAIALRLRGDQFKGNTKEKRAARAASVSGFLTTLARSDRYVARDEDTGAPLFTYFNNKNVNTVSDQQHGLQRDKLVCTLIPKNKIIELKAEIGVDATVVQTG